MSGVNGDGAARGNASLAANLSLTKEMHVLSVV